MEFRKKCAHVFRSIFGRRLIFLGGLRGHFNRTGAERTSPSVPQPVAHAEPSVPKKMPAVTDTKKSINDSGFAIQNGALKKYTGSGGDVVIPNSVNSIGNSAFSGCSSLTSITVPAGVTSIGDAAFEDCSHLTTITIPNSVRSIGSSAFSNCSSLTSISIPDGVTSIGIWTFHNCSHLTTITIPDSVTSIGGGAFSGCRSLTSITIPQSVTYIARDAFSNCNSLKTLPTVQPMCIDDAVETLRDRIIAQITKDPSVSYQLDGLLWGDAASCFPHGTQWDGAFFELDLIRKKLGARVSRYPDQFGYAPESYISLSASEFHRIAQQYQFSSVLQAFQSDEDWAMLFDESLDAAIASARSTLQKQEEERQNAERKKYAIKIPIELTALSPKMNVMTTYIGVDQRYGSRSIQLTNKNGKYQIRAGCYSRTLSAVEAVWFEKQLENTINNPDNSTWQSLPGGDQMTVEIKRKGYNDILLRSVKPRTKYTNFKHALEYLAQYGSQ